MAKFIYVSIAEAREVARRDSLLAANLAAMERKYPGAPETPQFRAVLATAVQRAQWRLENAQRTGRGARRA